MNLEHVFFQRTPEKKARFALDVLFTGFSIFVFFLFVRRRVAANLKAI